MSIPNSSDPTRLPFADLIAAFGKTQKNVSDQMMKIAADGTQATPATFLMLQFQMSQITQLGDSISNLVSQYNSVVSSMIRNQKVS